MKEGDTARAVPRGDGCGGALDEAFDADRAALSEGWAEGRTPADAAGDDAAGLLSSELVCAERPDGRRDAV